MNKLKQEEKEKVVVSISQEIKNIDNDFSLGYIAGYIEKLKEDSKKKPKLKTG